MCRNTAFDEFKPACPRFRLNSGPPTLPVAPRKIRTEAVSVTFCGSFPLRVQAPVALGLACNSFPLRVLGAICHAFRAASFLLNRNRNKSGSGLHHDDAARFRYAGVSVLLQYYIGDFDSWRIFRFVSVEYEERIDGIVGISDLLVIRIFGKYARHDP